ncbi:MAG: RNA methyltransferase [Planctomycetes bacterium]|jgi:TrmH family RNA methyltransferase|nr:RNA methyltransferase [Planctomycetota bacterium]
MSPRPVIRSIKNPLLQRAREVLGGRQKQVLALEGDRLIDDARRAGLEFEVVLVAEDRAARADELESLGLAVERVDAETLARVSKLATSPGALALVTAPKPRRLADLAADARTCVLAIAGVADPGNLGALARSAEAIGASGIVVVEGGASPWSEKALRGSMGSLLRVPVFVVGDAPAAARELASRGFRGVAAWTRGGTDYREFDWRGPLVLWVGSETGELPAGLGELARVSIPMDGAVESLNVSVATSLLLFEARRAREGKR